MYLLAAHSFISTASKYKRIYNVFTYIPNMHCGIPLAYLFIYQVLTEALYREPNI